MAGPSGSSSKIQDLVRIPVFSSLISHFHRFGSIGAEDRVWVTKAKGSPDVVVGALIDSGAVATVINPRHEITCPVFGVYLPKGHLKLVGFICIKLGRMSI